MSDETKFKAVHKMNLNNFLQQGEGQFIEFKEKFGFISLPRNKLLADVISKTIFMEKVGTGIKRIKDYCYNNNNGIKFEVEDYFFTIINSNKSKDGIKDGIKLTKNPQITAQNLAQKVGSKLVETQIKILLLMEENPRITKLEIASILELSTTAIDKNILKLKKLNLLKRIGPDKGGYWKILK